MPPQPQHTSAGHFIRDLLLRTFCWLALISSAIAPSATAEGAKQPYVSALLSNGNKLSGDTISTDKDQLIFRSANLTKPAKLKLDQVLSVQFAHPLLPRPEHLTTLLNFHASFRTTQADSLAGELLAINKDSVVFKTNNNGTKTIKRAFISSIETLQLGENYYRGPNSAAEWGINAANHSWKFSRNLLKSVATGGVGRDVKLAENSHVSFSASWQTSMRFRLLLYTSDASDDHADAYYDVNFNRSYAYLRTRGKVRGAGADAVARGGRWTQLNLPRDITKAKFDIYTQRKTGKMVIYIDHMKAAELESGSPDPIELGTGIRFIAEERYPITISDIAIRPWDGTTTPTPPKTAPKAPHPRLISSDDKIHSFVALKKENQDYIITAPGEAATTTRIPAVNVIKMVMPPAGAQPRKYANDIRVKFQHSGQLTFQLKNITNGKLRGHSKLLGDVSYDLHYISIIDFNIYDRQYEKLREKEP